MGTNVSLTPALEKFARDCVEDGRYNNVSEVVRAGLRLLLDQEDRKREFMAMLREAEEEGERDGFVSAEDAIDAARKAITAAVARQEPDAA